MLSTIASSIVLIPMLLTAVAGVFSTRGYSVDLRTNAFKAPGGRRSSDS